MTVVDAWTDGYNSGFEMGQRSMLCWMVFGCIIMLGVGFTVGYLW
jgi:hypothetical protein